ncbi:MAG TPA: hypothetical protein VJH63_00560 [Candidatus Paceibacterota bacterium]
MNVAVFMKKKRKPSNTRFKHRPKRKKFSMWNDPLSFFAIRKS